MTKLVACAGFVAVAWMVLGSAPAAQFRGLNVGTVTATVDGAPFSATVSVASMADGTLVLTNLSNEVQLQVPNAKVGTFPLTLDADGGLVDNILGLKVGNRLITPVSGSITIEMLDAASASGRFEFEGKDLATERPVTVTAGGFQVKLIPPSR